MLKKCLSHNNLDGMITRSECQRHGFQKKHSPAERGARNDKKSYEKEDND